MKKLILSLLIIVVSCSSPIAPINPACGYWVCSVEKNVYYAEVTPDSIYIQRTESDNGAIRSVTYSRGTWTFQMSFYSPYYDIPVTGIKYPITVKYMGDTLKIDTLNFVREL
jgi:hypothetical protein